jgi:hypothetical protein
MTTVGTRWIRQVGFVRASLLRVVLNFAGVRRAARVRVFN